MRFGTHVVRHRPFGVPMIGNVSNGYAIGLTEEGARLCDRLFAEEVSEAEIAEVSGDLLAHLKRGGFAEEACAPGGEAGAPGEAGTAPGALASAYLHVTHHCNLRCVGCYSGVDDRNARVDLPLETLAAMVRRLAAAGVQRLVISGGEPFLRADLPAIAQCAKEAGIGFVDVLTNGTCVGDDALAALAPWADRVAVSFDGVSGASVPHIRRKPLYDMLTDTVRRIREAGIAAHIIPTLHALNIDDAARYCALADELGATVNFSLLSAPSDGAEVAAALPDEEAQAHLARTLLALGSTRPVAVADTPVNTGLCTTVGCGAGCSMVSVSADGDVYPCHMLHDDTFKVGSLVEDDACLRQRRPPACAVEGLPACTDCEIRYLCGGGCRARAFFATGDVRARDPYCALMKTYYQLLFQAMVGSDEERR
ncbi:radical SAM protein [Adlercreutzia sp. R7]|uniref:Radical SAM protein n=1 Tax=Adlercreutzia wanghongyangiae TaxID=3111451 RepID=A0ABU6IIG0_9ACTN|nr:radical SAM protein [Adlercreutzia sp. R7]